MIVFDFFFDKMDLFGPHMENWAMKHSITYEILDHVS